jgi:4-diphosphocytidyl-2-C-methyl-D-erythritol kinase
LTIPVGELKGIAEAIGMDVPFFLVGGRAKAEGYGQIISPLPDMEPEWYVVARPTVGCSTPEAYRQLDERSYSWREFPEADELYNDFERVAPCECLDLIKILQRNGAKDAALSGSGSAVFGRFATQGAAEIARSAMKSEGELRTWVVKTLTRSESLK